MSIPRDLTKSIISKIEPGKVVVLYGPRQVGKTTLLKDILPAIDLPPLIVSGENRDVQTWLGSQSLEMLRQNLGSCRFLVIDEAQAINNIGINLKLLVDHFADLRVLTTGSASFVLSQQLGEPLVGRQWSFLLYPLAQTELDRIEAPHERAARLPSRLIYGTYPEVVTREHIADKQQLLHNLVDHYLFKDILIHENLRRSEKLLQILKMLAFQIGKCVSLAEIATAVGVNNRTVERYLDLLEKVFVIKKISGFSRNLRKEITKSHRYYFFDNGIRNAIINNFNALDSRDDTGQLWENYLILERLKQQSYRGILTNNYFWRTYDQKEIDWLEERQGCLYAYEIKWNPSKKIKIPRDFLEAYPGSSYEQIDRENYLNWLL